MNLTLSRPCTRPAGTSARPGSRPGCRHLFLAGLALLAALPVCPQGQPLPAGDWPFEVSVATEESRQAQRPARLALDIGFAPDATFAPEQQTPIRQSIEAMLSPVAGDPWLLVPLTLAADTPDLRPDLVYRIIIRGNMEAMAAAGWLESTSLTAPDPQTAAAPPLVSLDGKVDRYFRNAYAGLWQPLRTILISQVKPVQEYARILVKARPGSRVRIEQELEAVTGPAGGFYTTVRVPSSLVIHSSHPLAHDATQEYRVESAGTLELPQQTRPPLSLATWLHWLAYPGLELSLMLDDWFDLGLWTDLYVLGLVPSSPASGTGSLLTDYHRIDLGLEARLWSDRSTADFRAGFSTGVALHLDTLDGLDLDQTIPLSFQVGLPLELRLGDGIWLTLELLPTLSWTSDPDLVLAALTLNQQAIGNPLSVHSAMMLGDFILEPFHFRLGVRIQP